MVIKSDSEECYYVIPPMLQVLEGVSAGRSSLSPGQSSLGAVRVGDRPWATQVGGRARKEPSAACLSRRRTGSSLSFPPHTARRDSLTLCEFGEETQNQVSVFITYRKLGLKSLKSSLRSVNPSGGWSQVSAPHLPRPPEARRDSWATSQVHPLAGPHWATGPPLCTPRQLQQRVPLSSSQRDWGARGKGRVI